MADKQQYFNKPTGPRHEKRTHVIVEAYASDGNVLKRIQTKKPVLFALQKVTNSQPWARIVMVKETKIYDTRAGRVVDTKQSTILVDHDGEPFRSFSPKHSGFGVRVGSDLTNKNGVVPPAITNFLGIRTIVPKAVTASTAKERY